LHAVQFRIAEGLVSGTTLVNDEGPIILPGALYELHPGAGLAVGPAAGEVGLAAQRIIERTGEAVRIADDGLDGVAIFVYLGLQGFLRGIERHGCLLI
jgi:hypothetical protein